MIRSSIKWIISLALLLTYTLASAAVPAWKIVPSESNLKFTAIQNGAPVTGQFKTFSGEIYFDPNQLTESHVTITIDMTSVNDVYHKLADTLKTVDWFNVQAFPSATFKSTSFIKSKTGDKNYEAQGMLTIRDKTLPATLNLTLDEYSDTKARMSGSALIKRTAFGVGQGDWADTSVIKDDVKIDFVVNAVRK